MHNYINLCILPLLMDDTLQNIRALIADHPEGLSVTQIADEIGLNRNSTARYLDVLRHQGVITERKVGPAKLYLKAKNLPHAQQLDLYRKAMDAASCGIVIADARKDDFPLIYANQAFERLTGYPKKEILGKNCRFLQGTDTKQDGKKRIRAALRNHKQVTVVLRNYTKKGKRFYNELHLAPIFDDEGALTHYVGIQTDVSHRYKG